MTSKAEYERLVEVIHDARMEAYRRHLSGDGGFYDRFVATYLALWISFDHAHIDSSGSEEIMTDNEVFAFCQRAREAGYAITTFTPAELRGCDPRDVVDAMVEAGNERIEFLGGPDDEDAQIEQEDIEP